MPPRARPPLPSLRVLRGAAGTRRSPSSPMELPLSKTLVPLRFNFQDETPTTNFDTFPAAILTVFQVRLPLLAHFWRVGPPCRVCRARSLPSPSAPPASDVRPPQWDQVGKELPEEQVDTLGGPGFRSPLTSLPPRPGTDHSCRPLRVEWKALPRLLPPMAWPQRPLFPFVSGNMPPAAPGDAEPWFPLEDSPGSALSPSQSCGPWVPHNWPHQ